MAGPRRTARRPIRSEGTGVRGLAGLAIVARAIRAAPTAAGGQTVAPVPTAPRDAGSGPSVPLLVAVGVLLTSGEPSRDDAEAAAHLLRAARRAIAGLDITLVNRLGAALPLHAIPRPVRATTSPRLTEERPAVDL